jgi:hypothetical protein
VTFDQAHVGLTALVWIAGVFYMTATVPLVVPLRRWIYGIAIPVWVGLAVLYVWRFIEFTPGPPLDLLGLIARVAFFALALEGLLIPWIDRLEARPAKVVLTVPEEE